MRSLFVRAVVGMLVALAIGLAISSMALFRMSREAPTLVMEMHQAQLALVAEQVEATESIEEAEQLVRRLGPAMHIPMHLIEKGDPIPRHFSKVPLSNGLILASPPPPGRPRWGFTLVVQALIVLLLVGGVAWALTAPLLRDLQKIEHAVGDMREDDLTIRVPAVGAPTQPLAEAINRLAGRVESLVGGQRELLQAVSHELRTPLARLRFHLEELSEGPDPDALAGADEELGELDALIGELLVWLQSDVQDGPVVEVAVQPLAERSAARLVPADRALSVEVLAEGVVARGSEKDLERMLDNLIGNAIRYAAASVHVRATRSADAVVIEVSDDGPGFPADASRLLEPFATADEARSSGGNGLGLSIVHRICGRYGGTLDLGADSDLGGACVRVTLPDPAS